ncbi:MAG TPA: hypothetical protein VEF04_02065 [Blastocatellia bacterium]|nr:hypothetical protein [Blastocatellia bacterium]
MKFKLDQVDYYFLSEAKRMLAQGKEEREIIDALIDLGAGESDIEDVFRELEANKK